MIPGQLVDRVRRRLVDEGLSPGASEVAAALRAEGLVVGEETLWELVEALRSEMIGAGPLDALIRTPGVTDVLVNGHEQVWVDQLGRGLHLTDVRFRDEEAVRSLAQRLAGQAGRRLDQAVPWVDARLPSGVRLHAVLAPLAEPGTVLSLRVPSPTPLGMADLAARGSLPGNALRLLLSIVEHRLSFLVTGGTGAGKTTLLSAMLASVPRSERLVIVEDTGELRPIHPHVVSLQGRPPNIEGKGGIDMAVLVRQALRMRPDRLIVGEARGPELLPMLAALNTGHEGGCATVHARSAREVPARLEALGMMAGAAPQTITAMAAAGLECVIHVERGVDGRRAVQQIALLRDAGGRLAADCAIEWIDGQSELGPAWPDLASRLGIDAGRQDAEEVDASGEGVAVEGAA